MKPRALPARNLELLGTRVFPRNSGARVIGMMLRSERFAVAEVLPYLEGRLQDSSNAQSKEPLRKRTLNSGISLTRIDAGFSPRVCGDQPSWRPDRAE